MAQYQQPGDAVLYPQAGSASFAAAYPYGLARLHDVMLGESAARSDTIAGTDAPAPVVRRRLATGPPGLGDREQRAVARTARPAPGAAVPAGPHVAGQRLLAVPVRASGKIPGPGLNPARRLALSRLIPGGGLVRGGG